MDNIAIYIFIDGAQYGLRHWKVVPRVNDTIFLEGPKEGEYKVDRVAWCGTHTPHAILEVIKV